ncbi:SRPBCC family protein [Aurantiacibacter gilvus]|uniref:SRPBCC domain-containing protein n=1 Tax=Aurantiacibacter gilvus TaxID=3139141 RepID=A0ABU9IEQ3_9SPHN
MIHKPILAAAALVLSLPAAAQDVQSERNPVSEDEQALRQTLVLDAPLADLWNLFATDAGVSSWMAPVGYVDLRTGGMIRTNYNACAEPEDDGWIENTIVNFVPERMITLQANLEPQREASWMNETIYARRDNLYSVIEFEAVSPDQTRLTMWGLGYGIGPEWETILGFFTAGNEWTFAQLQRAVAGEQVYPGCDE